jgi:hypothetical protein
LGGARVSRAGERVLAIANFLAIGTAFSSNEIKKTLFRGTAKTESPRRPLLKLRGN